MHKHEIKEAWVDIAPDNGPRPVTPGRWAFEFRPAMGRLLSAHPTIGAAFQHSIQRDHARSGKPEPSRTGDDRHRLCCCSGLLLLSHNPRRVSACRGRRPCNHQDPGRWELARRHDAEKPKLPDLRTGRQDELDAHQHDRGRLAASPRPGIR